MNYTLTQDLDIQRKIAATDCIPRTAKNAVT